jgi:pyruvate,water dikinase
MVELGRRFVSEKYIDEPNDIFYLLVSEIKELFDELVFKHTQGRSHNLVDLRPTIRKRKEDFQKQSEWNYPTVLGVIPKEAPTEPVAVLIYGATPENIERAMASAERVKQVTEFNGLPGSAGICEGIARIVIEARDIKEVMPGEILVCPFTNPLWNPVFTKIRGVVTDTGGSLCHTVIIAREYGIPAVCGTGYGTKVIKTGDKIRVDGTRGLITKLQSPD